MKYALFLLLISGNGDIQSSLERFNTMAECKAVSNHIYKEVENTKKRMFTKYGVNSKVEVSAVCNRVK